MTKTTLRCIAGPALLVGRGSADVHVVQGGMTACRPRGWSVEGAHPEPE